MGGYGVDSGPSDTCGDHGGALTALDSSAETEPAYDGPMWVYTAPPGSTIAGGSVNVSLTSPQGEAYLATPENLYAQADVLINCQFNLPCGSNGTETRTVPITDNGGTQLFAVALCVGPYYGATTCPPGSGGGLNARISISSADIELTNDATPAGSAFAGALLQPAASGTEGLTFDAEDANGPGVYRVIANVDGAEVYDATPDTNGGRCTSIGTDTSGIREFLYARPCKQNVAVDVPVDTTRLSNGRHQLSVIVEDAAGNRSVVYDGTISTSNAVAGASSARLSDRPPPVALGPANGSNASKQATLTADWTSNDKAHLTGRYGKPAMIEGRLTTPDGTAIAGALVDVTYTPTYPGAQPVTMTGPRTGPNGNFTVTMPDDISSCTVRLSYRSHIEDATPAATAALTLSVPAAITLDIAPRIAQLHEKIAFSGVLHGGPIPPGGKHLVLEARSAGTAWLEFEVIRTSASGHFHASHRFHLPGPATYQFRVVSEAEADFPFSRGASNKVVVHER